MDTHSRILPAVLNPDPSGENVVPLKSFLCFCTYLVSKKYEPEIWKYEPEI